ncbi:hypothetical protein DSO57_1017962 [Entomophthora muscae]|uniref:Uncharacterized protein n=1 Tax=Entomophthora muscae TaxID=34485 RepID=A0ACC2SHB4_9FUNG|nr:hypothetical protein DSO57_1017962 [Entomophthora muscae]
MFVSDSQFDFFSSGRIHPNYSFNFSWQCTPINRRSFDRNSEAEADRDLGHLLIDPSGRSSSLFTPNGSIGFFIQRRRFLHSKSRTKNFKVYFDPEHHLTLMQFRAPIIQGMMANFVNELFEVIGLYKFNHVVVLSSYDMTLRVDSQIQDSNLRWLCHSRSLTPSVILPSEIKQLELEMEDGMPSPTEGEQLPHLPGSGFTRKFLLLAQKKSFDNAVALFAFVSEGDNRIDASLLASFLDGILHLNSAKNGWKPPPSWNMLFGSEIASGLYN